MLNKVQVLVVLFVVGISSLNAHSAIGIKRNAAREFAGFNQEGLEKLKEVRDAVRERFKIFNNEFRSLGALHHQATVARITKYNIYMYGPPGGAKSGVAGWMIKGESEPAFELQLNQMMTEQAFIGGQNFEKAKQGEFEINTKGSAADFKVVLIDEAEKGNPAALAALLSLLNEREILAGNQKIKAKTETVASTSNANLPELFMHFLTTGQSTTAAAFLNRFQLKAMVYNWLSLEDQKFLDKRQEERRQAEAMRMFDPDLDSHELFVAQPVVDWPALRQFIGILIRPNTEFQIELRNIMNDMRAATNKAVRESELAFKARREDFVYFPSFDYTERLRQQVPSVIYASLMIDFLLSDLANDDNLERNTNRSIELGPLSLWRAALMLTTVGPGDMRLVYNDAVEQAINIEFGAIDEANLRDEREKQLVQNLKNEQTRFRDVFLTHIKGVQASIAKSTAIGRNSDLLVDRFDVLELLLLKK
jgi:MoxR-like ATPase